MNIKKIFNDSSKGSFCFYCSIDSAELKTFLIVVIGGLVFASAFVALGAYLKGHFKNIEDPELKGKVLKLEGEEDARE